jgi:CO/xanthine dehydrogenase Mo-binding subunit
MAECVVSVAEAFACGGVWWQAAYRRAEQHQARAAGRPPALPSAEAGGKADGNLVSIDSFNIDASLGSASFAGICLRHVCAVLTLGVR